MDSRRRHRRARSTMSRSISATADQRGALKLRQLGDVGGGPTSVGQTRSKTKSPAAPLAEAVLNLDRSITGCPLRPITMAVTECHADRRVHGSGMHAAIVQLRNQIRRPNNQQTSTQRLKLLLTVEEMMIESNEPAAPIMNSVE
jgi:hypothetical protein